MPQTVDGILKPHICTVDEKCKGKNSPPPSSKTHFCFYQSFLFTNKCTSECLKNNIKIYIKIAPTCLGAVTPSSGSSLSKLC